MKKINTRSVKFKLLTMIIVLVAIPILIICSINYSAMRSSSLDSNKTELEWKTKYLTEEIASIVKSNITALQTLAASPATSRYLNGDTQIRIDELVKMCQDIDKVFNDGNATIITNADGDQIVRTVGDCVNTADRDYFQQAMAGNTYISNVIVSKSNGVRMLTIAVPVYDGNTVVGICQRNYDLNDFRQYLLEAVDENQEALIVAWDGIVATHSLHELNADSEVEDRSKASFFTSGKDSGYYEADTGKGYSVYISYMKEAISGYIVMVNATSKAVVATANKAASFSILIGIILFAAGIAVTLFFTKTITDPIKAINGSLAEMTDGRFVKIDKFTERKDEFGEMVNNTNSVMDKLTAIVGDIKNSSGSVGTSSADLSEMAGQISQTAEDVSNAVQEIATGATQQAEEIQKANESVLQIGTAVADVQTQAKTLEGLASNMKSASEVSAESLESLRKSSDKMSKQIEDIEKTINATKEAVTSMGEKVEGISSIASQTNLLSLNASIEAARAGEAGRGFAVVAEEIGKLADSTKVMAGEIKNEMEILLTQSEAAVSAALEVKEGNSQQKEAVGETLGSIGGMIDDIKTTVNEIQKIGDEADSCARYKDVVIDVMNSLSAISEENAASSEETGASMEELSATVTTLAQSAHDLKDISDNLTDEMGFFKD